MGWKESGIQDKNLLEPPWFYPEENSMEENKEISSFFAAKYYYSTQEKIKEKKYFYCILSLPHASNLKYEYWDDLSRSF